MLDSFAKIHFWCPTVGQRDRICTEHRKMSCSTLRLKGQCKNISLKIINYYSLGNLLLSLFSWTLAFSSVQFSSVALLCPTLCDPMNCSTLGLPIHHQLPESTQTHVHCVGDAIQPFHPLLSPSPPALNLSHHHGLFSESALCIRWPKYWCFSFNISPSNITLCSRNKNISLKWCLLLSKANGGDSQMQHRLT